MINYLSSFSALILGDRKDWGL